uniref:C-type lectin domain-containing protein n=1 Tax=Varanus komodoensis TaxID=61221 RepID=A0A8D2IXE7_VARKO
MVNTAQMSLEMVHIAREDAALSGSLDEEAPQQSAANGRERAANGALQSPPGRRRRPGRCCGLSSLGRGKKIMVIIVLLSVPLVASGIVNVWQAVRKSPQTLVAPSSLCPQGWHRNGSWDYLFSDRESNWPDSQNNCSSLGGSLVKLETEMEKDFIMNNMKKDLYWLGIRRKDEEPWHFPNASIFHNLSLNEKEGNCAFLNEDRVDASVCSFSRLWICRKPVNAH